jgi:hypothetical protein
MESPAKRAGAPIVNGTRAIAQANRGATPQSQIRNRVGL